MKPTDSVWPLSSILLLLFGATLVLIGLYFILLRPPLLPEDLRYIGASHAQLEFAAPRLAGWLTQLFRVMGGYVSATGILTIMLATTTYRSHRLGAAIAAASAGLASIGGMTFVNFIIDSDFKWMLFGTAVLWACSVGLFCIERARLRGG